MPAGNATRRLEPNPTKQFRKKTSPEYVATPRWEERRERARDASRRGAQLHMGHVLLVAAAWGPDRHIPRHVAAGCGYVAAARAHTDTIHLGVPRSRPRRPLLPLSARTPTFFLLNPHPTSASQQKTRPRGRSWLDNDS
jgi:hypothetical protein